ncbi:MAG: hypothetical protein KatS3mg015_2894 [Fimbriimonadales bacterium]|nr:MAG: hypothetical protein KatS3mg015_2894 [Fimbriimonadales bacterium]
MRILGWTYEADVHCDACTMARFGGRLPTDNDADREGNVPWPIFAIDEWFNVGHSDVLACGDCGEILDTYTE